MTGDEDHQTVAGGVDQEGDLDERSRGEEGGCRESNIVDEAADPEAENTQNSQDSPESLQAKQTRQQLQQQQQLKQ